MTVTAHTVTENQLRTLIVDEMYYGFPGTTTTVCCLKLQNGFTVIGHSACVDPANFDERVGRSIAYDNAFQEMWQLEGYRLCQELHHQSTQ